MRTIIQNQSHHTTLTSELGPADNGAVSRSGAAVERLVQELLQALALVNPNDPDEAYLPDAFLIRW